LQKKIFNNIINMPSSFPTGINSMKLKVSTYEQDFSSASLGNNVIPITEQNIINVLESPGVNTIPSIVATYSNSAVSSGSINIEIAGTPYINIIPSSWVQRGANIDGEANSDQTGWSVSLSADGSIVAIGAPYYQGDGTYRGNVRVYARNGTTWVQRGANINGEADSDFSGYSVSLSADGSIVAIGAPNNAGGGYQRGHVRVYAWNGTIWVQRGADIDGEADYDHTGWSVSLSSDGSIVAIGAPNNAVVDGGLYRGYVRVYAWNGTTWVQRGANINGEADYDESGYSVSLSTDGSIVAIGAPGSRGRVRVYEWNGTTWVQRGANIDGEANYDRSGQSVSLSTDGSIVAIGAPYNAGGGHARGRVRLLEYS
jgi:hypothetical protein